MSLQDKVIQEASKWVGYLEKKSNSQLEDFKANAGSNNYTIFAKWYNEWWNANYQGQPWCAMFVSCIFRLALGAGIQEDIMSAFAYCPAGINQFKRINRYITVDPKIGDIIFFKDNNSVACHVGIVYDVDSKNVYTIEGNTSSVLGVISNGGTVAKKSYFKEYIKILGYGRPDYAKYKNMEEETEVIYNYMDNNMPTWAKPTIQKLMDKGLLKGNEKGELGLNDTMLKIFVVNDRAGLYK